MIFKRLHQEQRSQASYLILILSMLLGFVMGFGLTAFFFR
jgi:hypothetical protein